jgi:hypothetical protein
MGATLNAGTQPRTFIERDDWLRAVCASDLPHVTARIAVRIGLHLNVTSGRCDPGIDKIATGSNISERSAYRQVAALRRAGWLAIRRGGGRQRSNEYTLKYPDTALSGFKPLNPDSGDNETLTERVINPDNRWQTKSGTAKRTGAGAKTPAPRGERERELTLACPLGALAVGGAPEKQEVIVDRFTDLLAVWQRPWGEDDEPAAHRAFAEACREADPDDIIASARRWVAAADEPRFLKPLTKWLAKGLWQKQPPSRAPQRNGGKVSLSRLALEIGNQWRRS